VIGRLLLASTAVFALASAAPSKSVSAVAHVDLRVADNPAAEQKNYVAVESIIVPNDHKIGNKYFPYEGIGWENELIGYRIYLDERTIADVFGKKVPAISLPTINQQSKYHEMSAWGLDVMHVGPSMGVGGLGLYRDGKLQRFGKVEGLSAGVDKAKGKSVSFTVTHRGVALGSGSPGNVSTSYEMHTGSPVTWVSVQSDLPENTLASGLVASPNSSLITPPKPVNGWTYIARWGAWSENKDELGIVLFYRNADAERMPDENESNAIRFKKNSPRYAFAAVWGKGPQGIDTAEEFKSFLASTLRQVARGKS
jgi:hypothetical protein